MQPWLRLLVTCLLALALPVQGIAAVTRAHCGPSHQRMQVDAPAGHPGHQAHHGHHRHHPEEAHAGHGAHQHHDTAAVAASADAGAQPVAEQTGADLAKFKCSSCAACCVGSALARTMPQVPQPAGAPTVFAFVQVAIDACASDGPDRPPRPLLA